MVGYNQLIFSNAATPLGGASSILYMEIWRIYSMELISGDWRGYYIYSTIKIKLMVIKALAIAIRTIAIAIAAKKAIEYCNMQ